MFIKLSMQSQKFESILLKLVKIFSRIFGLLLWLRHYFSSPSSMALFTPSSIWNCHWPKWCETAKAWTRCTNIFAKILQMYWRILFRNSKYVYDICASDEFRAYEVWTEAFNGMCVYLEMLVFVMLFVLVFDIKHIFTSTLVESVIHRPPLERLDVHWYVCKRPQCIKPTPMNNPKILESPLRASYASHSLHRHEKQKFDFQL